MGCRNPRIAPAAETLHETPLWVAFRPVVRDARTASHDAPNPRILIHILAYKVASGSLHLDRICVCVPRARER